MSVNHYFWRARRMMDEKDILFLGLPQIYTDAHRFSRFFWGGTELQGLVRICFLQKSAGRPCGLLRAFVYAYAVL